MHEGSLRTGPVACWAIWRRPAWLVVLVLAVEAAALAVVVASSVLGAADIRDVALTGCLVALSVVHIELATGIERVRRRVADTSYFDLSSVWTFAAAVTLPSALPGVVIGAVYLHLWLRVWKPARVPLHRHLYTTATVVLAAYAAHLVVRVAVVWVGGVQGWSADAAGLAALGAAVVVYALVNTALVAAAIALTGENTQLKDLLGHWDDNTLEVATLCLGAVAAVTLASNPWLVVLALPPLLVLHRAVLVRQLEEVVRTDGKTGLLTAAAWHALATREARRSQQDGRAVAVLVLDLDHFKAVNDEFGHLAGDDVLVAVAAALRTEVRNNDLVGRFGGEEFVVLLPDLPCTARTDTAVQDEVRAVAERIRRRVSALAVATDAPGGPVRIDGLSVSVGGALLPAVGGSLEQVMKAADAALYTAKRGGRDLVRMAGEAHVPAARRPPSEVSVVARDTGRGSEVPKLAR